MAREKSPNRYDVIIAELFRLHYKKGLSSFEFDRDEINRIAIRLKVEPPKNFGDVIYSYRFRKPFPDVILKTAPSGMEWVILLAGQGKYRFKLLKFTRLIPRAELLAVKIPDATPEIITKYAQTDEQALLAKVRYNRLIDIFLGIAGYSLQSHLRTTVEDMGQIEIDEVYVGVNKHGIQFVVPVQAKGGGDQIGVAQVMQDIACCATKFSGAVCRSVAVQFMKDNVIAMFEVTVVEDELKVVEERHYQLVPSDTISGEDLMRYRRLEV